MAWWQGGVATQQLATGKNLERLVGAAHDHKVQLQLAANCGKNAGAGQKQRRGRETEIISYMSTLSSSPAPFPRPSPLTPLGRLLPGACQHEFHKWQRRSAYCQCVMFSCCCCCCCRLLLLPIVVAAYVAFAFLCRFGIQFNFFAQFYLFNFNFSFCFDLCFCFCF